jgi:DNA mismatch repair protein MSH5
VYLKQNAIIVYLAHIGSFVPANEATITLTDKILTRITTRETISKAQSAFMIDLQQISSIVRSITPRSLVIIDEFGKGTNAADGAGLLCGLFRYLLEDENRPMVLAATHFHEIFEAGYLDQHPNLAFGHMEVKMDKRAVKIEDQVTYLYNLVPGRSASSFGTVCAAMNGIDKDVINRAEDLLLLQAKGANIVDACTTVNDIEVKQAVSIPLFMSISFFFLPILRKKCVVSC